MSEATKDAASRQPIPEAEVQAALHALHADFVPGQYSVERLYEARASATAFVGRIRGEDWSLVVKELRPDSAGHPHWQAGRDASHWYYWKREALLYRSGWLDQLAPGLRAPHLLHAADRPDGTVALYLEDLRDLPPALSWPLSRYGRLACQLGIAQAAMRAHPMLEADWLSHGWLRSYLTVRDADFSVLERPAIFADARVRHFLPASLRHDLLALRRDRDRFLSLLESMPATLAHLDLHPGNIFGTDAETLLVDWAFSGAGAVGEDPGNLVPDAVLDFCVPVEEIGALYEITRDGYRDGLQSGGWAVSRARLDAALSAAMAAKYAWIGPALLRTLEDNRATINRRPLDEALPVWAGALRFILSAAAGARDLGRWAR